MELNISKPKLFLQWHAFFSNSLVLKQFEEDRETKFDEVKKRFDNLLSFKLIHISKPLSVEVNLMRGFILIDTKTSVITLEPPESKFNIRLIYFRRNYVDFDIRGEILKHTIYYFLGFQYNDKNNKNHKVLLKIDQEGNINIEDA